MSILHNRLPLGMLNGIQGEPGTILGPMEDGKYLVVIKQWEELNAIAVGWAKAEDMSNAALAVAELGPRSITELKLVNYYRR